MKRLADILFSCRGSVSGHSLSNKLHVTVELNLLLQVHFLQHKVKISAYKEKGVSY